MTVSQTLRPLPMLQARAALAATAFHVPPFPDNDVFRASPGSMTDSASPGGSARP